MRVLDCCAAPGGKSFAAALQMQNRGTLYSCDIHPHRLDLIERGAERLGISILETHLQDASQPVPAWRSAMDVVLADVPCSGLGVIRKKPDIRYHEPSAECPALQRAILAQQAEYVRPGGVLLYSTCTILRRENEAVAEDFLRTHPDFVPENAPWPEGLRASRRERWSHCFRGSVRPTASLSANSGGNLERHQIHDAGGAGDRAESAR